MEPFVTIRAHPRRFAWGIPLVFVVSFALGLALVEVNLSLAIAVQLFVQTVGLLWLYVPAARDLRAQERAEWERRRQEAGDAGRAGGDHANGDHARGNQAWGDAGHGAGSARPLPGDAGQTSAETAEADEEPDVTRR
ncbi:MAG: hypothetical protein EA352_04965 [Gemmatimonadales bacterium]|nr:MAG: hypothetical protein EA352_04965 [Gemmatimonadales bacterium]